MASSLKEFAHLQIPLEDVLKATNNFADKNIIGEGDFGKVYKGQLLQSGKLVKIAARRLDLIGFCDEKYEKIIINSYNAKGSLLMHLSNPTLTWIQRLNICIGIFRALSYIHKLDGRSYSVLHRNINSSTILLDDNFEAKLSGFEYSIQYSVSLMNQVLFSQAIGTKGYMDPAIEKTGGVTQKSDIYSFGVVLWEVLCGRKAFIPSEDEDNRFLASLAKYHYENRTLNDIIHPDLWKQMTLKSLTSFSEAAYSCLKDERVQRPDMNIIVRELEDALEFQLRYENVKENLKHLKIQLGDIMLATDNFSEAYRIGSTSNYDLYKAELDHFDKVNPSSVEGQNKGGLPKRWSTVLIKRIHLIRKIKVEKEVEEVFITELEMLTTCKHRNIVTLVGFCDEGSEMVLVIDHTCDGYLDDYWRYVKDKSVLTWAKRLKICLDVAHALKYLHYEMEDQKTIINRDIRSEYIVLDENWGAKIMDLGLSVFLPPNQDDDALYHKYSSGPDSYIDPEYMNTCKLKRESDVYSFGVVLFEVLCGRVAYDEIYTKESEQGLAHVARININKGLIEEMVDSIIKEEGGLNRDSLDKFIEIAYRCTAQTQKQRPTMNVVVKELEHALFLQERLQLSNKDEIFDEIEKPVELKLTHESPKKERVQHPNVGQIIEEVEETIELKLMHENRRNKLERLKIPLSEVMLATDNFSKAYLVGVSEYYYNYEVKLDHYDTLYRSCIEGKNNGELPKRRKTVAIRRLIAREDKLGEEVFFTDIEILSKCNHHNIVIILAFCNEGSEMILVIDHASNGNLSICLENMKDKLILTWTKRLKICLGVAHGLKYLHYEMEDQKTIINQKIQTGNIVLDENWVAKIRFFGNSVLLSPNQDDYTLNLDTILIEEYTDPEFQKTGKLKRESDVYSFGLLLFEVLFGKTSGNLIYSKKGEYILASVARRGFREGTLTEMIDPIIMEGSGDYSFTLNRGPNKSSLDKFIKIAYECLAETQDQRPTMKVVAKELEKALFFQENNNDDPRISLSDVAMATQNFHEHNCIGRGGFGNVYMGKVPKGDGFDTIVAKRLDRTRGQGEQQFRNELQILVKYKHENVIRLVGYCDEKDAKVIVYEYASKGSLDKYLGDAQLTWMKRLNICIDVATALEFLHGGLATQAAVIHRDIKTENILLNNEWEAKLADYGLSLISAINQETDYVFDHACGTEGYVDPLYRESGFLTMESDIYSFGVVLFEILCGRSTFQIRKDEGQYLPSFIKQIFEEGKHNEVVFEAIKTQIVPKALTAFQTIAYRCLHDDRKQRPTAKKVLEQLKEALEFQEDDSCVGTTLVLK